MGACECVFVITCVYLSAKMHPVSGFVELVASVLLSDSKVRNLSVPWFSRCHTDLSGFRV